jgi:hypothetical protein
MMPRKKKDTPEERLKKLEGFFDEIQYLLRRYNEDKDGFHAGDVEAAIKEYRLNSG